MNGLKIAWTEEFNFKVQVVAAILAIFLGWFFEISRTEWTLVIAMIGFVLAAEAFNTAIEIDMDLTSPEYHPYAKDTKDVAAGAVLLAALTALIVGLFIFSPYMLGMLK